MKTRFVTRSELRYSIRCLEHALTERNVYVRDLEASLAAAERKAEKAEAETDHWQKVAASQVAPLAHRATEAERRLSVAREAFEAIRYSFFPAEADARLEWAIRTFEIAKEALAALDGEGEAE